MRALAPHARVVAVDLPGAGRSSPVRSPLAFGEHGAWAGRLLERLGGRDVTLVGHSNSGPVALLAAARAPAGLARLVLADAVGARPRRSLPRVL
ncbi:MAG TPA: alpha/beta fold hydrolase, partial [Polyangiaceae bacterium]|nr:alpha/beta fold hydrolase [Polyangiaceae bacterium]